MTKKTNSPGILGISAALIFCLCACINNIIACLNLQRLLPHVRFNQICMHN